jgi:hypothetical protein
MQYISMYRRYISIQNFPTSQQQQKKLFLPKGVALKGFYCTVLPWLFDNPLFENPALSEVDQRSRFYLYINQYKYERFIRNALSEYLLFFEVKFRSRLDNYERILHLLFEASLIIIQSQTN